MSRIDDLIRELCPRGVNFRPLWQLTTWDKKFNAVERSKQPKVCKYRYLLASEMTSLAVDDGDVKLLTTNESDLWTTEDLAGGPIHEAEVVAIPWGGNALVQYFKGRFITSDNRIAVANDPAEINMKFLYYFMQGNVDTLTSFYRGSGIKHPSMAKVLDWRVPVPPLELQREIVRILDQFTQLKAELEAELEARTRQYDYYSETLLSSTGAVAAGTHTLGELLLTLIDHRGKTPKKLGGDWTDSGHRVVSAINIKSGVVDANDHHYVSDEIYAKWMSTPLAVGDVLLTSEAPLGSVAHIDRPVDWAVGQRIFGLRPNPALLHSRYLFHVLRSGDTRRALLARSTGSTVSGIRQSELVKVEIRLPSLQRQAEIATTLDELEALVHSLSSGLPAELAARRKQYEHYRDKLLTFQEAAG